MPEAQKPIAQNRRETSSDPNSNPNMRLHRRIARAFRSLFLRCRADAEMKEEMSFHLEQRAADYAAEGLPESDARYAAQRRFGNVGSLQERGRDAWGFGWLERTLK